MVLELVILKLHITELLPSSLFLRPLFTMTRSTGVMKMNLTSLEERLSLMKKRPNYPPTGTHLSPRYVLE